jgi:protein subunit release factor B
MRDPFIRLRLMFLSNSNECEQKQQAGHEHKRIPRIEEERKKPYAQKQEVRTTRTDVTAWSNMSVTDLPIKINVCPHTL